MIHLPNMLFFLINFQAILKIDVSVKTLPWIRGPRVKKAVRRTSEQSERSGTSGRMKSKPRSDELSQSHQSGTCSWSVQSQMTRWPHHTSKQQIWQQNNCTIDLDALLTG